MSQNNHLTDMKSLLAGIMQQKNWQPRLELHRLFSFWNKAVGQVLAAHAQPEVIRGTVLWVRVSDSVWMQQLQLQKNDLLAVVNDRLGDEKITDLRFKLQAGAMPVDEIDKTPASKPPLLEIDKNMIAEFENMISSIDDEKIRASLKRLWITLHQVRPPED